VKKKKREGKGGSRAQRAKEQKRKRTNTNKTKKGGRRVVEEALVALARLWPEKPDAKWEGERGVR